MRRLRSARGQTTTEFVMIAGFAVVIATGMLLVMSPTVQRTLQVTTECVISDVCAQTPNEVGTSAPAVFPGTGTPAGGEETPGGTLPPGGLMPSPGPGSGGPGGTPGASSWPIPLSACEVAINTAKLEIDACSYTRTDKAFCAGRAVIPHGYDLTDGISDIDFTSFFVPGGPVTGIAWDTTKNANARLQNCNALWKRSACACETCAECDGWIDQGGGNVICLHNGSDDTNVGKTPEWSWAPGEVIDNVKDAAGKVPDFAESAGFIRDVTRMMEGKDPIVTENDSVRQMKQQILMALDPKNGDPKKPIELIGHSEGSIILAEALWQLRIEFAITQSDWKRIKVDVIGPAEMRFPPELQGSVAAYYNGGPGDPPDADPIPTWIGSPVYQEALATTTRGTIAVPDFYDSYDDTNWPCTKVRCHDKHAYLQFVLNNDRQRGDPAPGTTIMVNGVDTTADDWSNNCRWYQSQRYDERAS